MVTTIARPPVSNNPVSLPTYDKATLQQLQKDYGLSCTKYEQLAEKRLSRSDTIIISGVGCALRVKNNALMVFPGKTHNAQKQETEMLYRGVHGIKLILLLTDKGLLTLDAIKWCDEQNIAVLMLDSRGNVIQSLSPENLSNASLRRKQYADNVSGKIAHELVKRKIIAQLDTLKSHLELPGRDNAIDILTSAIQEISGNTLPGQFYDVDWLRTFEARAACAYFNAWTGLRIKWDTQAKKTIPPMWQSVSARTSPLSKNHGGRHAVCPLQT